MIKYIYTLDCPITLNPMYVGSTINPKQRLAQHIRSREKSDKYKWVLELKEQKLKPLMTIIDEVESDFDYWEVWYSHYIESLGFKLLNEKYGIGEFCQSVKDKISVALKGKKKSEEH